MTFIGMLLLTLYVMIAVFSIYMTYRERCWNPEVSKVYGRLGYVLCLFWPLTILITSFSLMLPRRSA